MTLDDVAAARMRVWSEQGLERFPAVFDSAQNPHADIDGQRRVLLSSSNYLGLSEHPEVIATATQALATYGAGSGGSRLTTGTTRVHQEVERRLAQFIGYEQVVFFATGYQANLSVLQTLASAQLTIYSDALNHASLIDGIRLARAQGAHKEIYPHLDYAELERQLAQCSTEHRLVVSDGLFSMDGDYADLQALREICDAHDAWLLIDDAHGIGTLGSTGRGLCQLQGTQPDILVGTASKALGAEGGFIACSSPVARLLRNQARSFVYSTACSAANCAAVIAAVDVIDRPQGPEHPVRRLQERAEALHKIAGDLSPTSLAACSPIIPLPVGDEAQAMELSAKLKRRGFHVPAIRYPTVRRGEAILRTTAMSTLEWDDIQAFAAALTELGWRPQSS